MRRRAAGRSVGLALFALLTACSGGLPPTHYYTLSPPGEVSDAGIPAATSGLVVGVEPLAVDPPYDQDRLIYRREPDSQEVGFYAYHRWAAPLGDLLKVALADGLRGTPGLAAIEPRVASGSYTAHLGGRVLHLEEIGLGAERQARLALELTLRSVGGEILWSATLTGSARGRAESAPEVVALMGEAFESALGQARTGLAAALVD